jgi:HK97 family phage major capsid protein
MPPLEKTPTEVLNENLVKFFDETGKFAGTVEETKTKMAALEVKQGGLEKLLVDINTKLAAKRGSLQGGDDLVSLLGDKAKRYFAKAEIVCRMQKSSKDGGRSAVFADDVPLKVATGMWLAGHLKKLVSPADFHVNRDLHEKLTLLLNGGVEKVALQEDTAAEGGNLVPTVVEGEILRLVQDNSVLRPLVRKILMTTKTHAFPKLDAEFTAAIIAEEGSITDSTQANPFGQTNLTAKKLACFSTVSGELLQDNVVGLADWLGMEFGMKIGRLEDTQALEGDGTGANFTGVVAASGVNSVTSGANGDFLSWQKLVDAMHQNVEMNPSDNVWFMRKTLWGRMLATRVGTAGTVDLPFFAPALGFTVAPMKAILGDQVLTHSGLLANRAVGTGTNRTNAYYGPPSTIIFGDLLGFEIALNPWAKFQTYQTDIRGLKRTGIMVGVPAAWTKYTAIDPAGLMAV